MDGYRKATEDALAAGAKAIGWIAARLQIELDLPRESRSNGEAIVAEFEGAFQRMRAAVQLARQAERRDLEAAQAALRG